MSRKSKASQRDKVINNSPSSRRGSEPVTSVGENTEQRSRDLAEFIYRIYKKRKLPESDEK